MSTEASELQVVQGEIRDQTLQREVQMKGVT
jgi:hypothetical protein